MLAASTISAADGAEILNRFFQQKENQHCFDCDAPANEFISVNNGVSLCRKCAEMHRSFGNEDISLVKSSKAQGWTLDELKMINGSGNKKLTGFMKEWDMKKDNSSFYKTKGSYHYRRQLLYDVDGLNLPEPITKGNSMDIVDNKPLLTKASEGIQNAKERVSEAVSDAKTAVQDPNFTGNLKEKAVHLKDETIQLASKGIETIKSGIMTAVEKIKGVTHTGAEETKETTESVHHKAAPKENVTKAPKEREVPHCAAGDIITVHHSQSMPAPEGHEQPATRPNRFEDAECDVRYDAGEGTPVQLADLVYRYEQEHHHLPPLETSSKDLVISQLKHHTDPVLREHLTRASKKGHDDIKLGEKTIEAKEDKNFKVHGDPLLKNQGQVTKEGVHEASHEVKAHGDPFAKEFVTKASKKAHIDDKLTEKVTPVHEKKSGELTPKDSTNKGKETFGNKAAEAKQDQFQSELKVQGDPFFKHSGQVTKEGIHESSHEVKSHGDPFAKEFVTRASKKAEIHGVIIDKVTPVSDKKSGDLTPKDSREQGSESFGDKASEVKEQKFEGQNLKVQGDPLLKNAPLHVTQEGPKESVHEVKAHGDPFAKEFVTRASKKAHIDDKIIDKVTPINDRKSGDLTPKDANEHGIESFGQKAKEEVQELKQESYNVAAGKKETTTKVPKKNQTTNE